MKRAIFPVLAAFTLILSSCSLPFTITWNTPAAATVPAVSTPIVITATPEAATQAATAAPTSAPTLAGQEMNLGGVYMVVPPCLAGSASGSIVPANNPGADMPPFAYNPQYRKIVLTGYPLSGKQWPAEINVYPIAEFEQLVPDNVIDDVVGRMQQVLQSQAVASTTTIPFLPVENAAQVFGAQIRFLNFQNGKGVGWLTEFAQYYAPANNNDLFYAYQGMTDDGKYWISVSLPVNAPYLQTTYNDPAVPADGIAMPDPSTASEAEMKAYYTNMVDKLNNTPPDTFTPSLACIDSFLQTIHISD